VDPAKSTSREKGCDPPSTLAMGKKELPKGVVEQKNKGAANAKGGEGCKSTFVCRNKTRVGGKP